MDYQDFIVRCNQRVANTLMQTLSIKYLSAAEGYLMACMPVNKTVHQPMGLLHGGASAALAESVGSAASMMFIDAKRFEIRGIELSVTHLKSISEGMVYAKARIVHKGKTLHYWEVRIEDENEQLVSICKLTNIILERRHK
jgi:1,4-dihydroxy-2-naphthoyl-CoA hydrolase